ncbi:Transglycosylase domain protein [Xylanimonas cellulosilytica DSM 15894]|uniref:Transglycosylase domain protein n=1 Tax=Xylanimonas cellulosilytica (strain DSM 15894 / JCM 12276 / CECT 5975 / KCTC 9989 / LMG 20990 / NBRC 107835 / XIL07) TaxID=446471 RepID=D1BXV0_XYLCX|nr:resuscitation-promoting factor [Xylanimonas cellulosilytica]ACZ31741.1 Transglycosylase domain protein [Xylanimonas cellulosilytica DSM 15894]
MTASHRTAPSGPSSTTPVVLPLDPAPPRRPRRRRGRRLLAAGVTVVALLAGGATGAVADARKSVTLDVDGRVTHLTTFAGSVEGLLRTQGLRLEDRDVVAPAPQTPLRDGSDVVVRFGRELTVEADGDRAQVWVAALDADDALSRLAARGDDVRLVASRAGERVSLPLRLAADGGKVLVRADGASRTVPDTGDGVEALLAAADVSVDDDDLVSVIPSASSGARVTLLVQRVVTQEVTTTTAVPFERVEQEDPDRYVDRDPKVVQAGVEGVRTRVERVTTVDGTETARVLLSEDQTTAPVDEVVAIGTRERPAPPPPADPPASSAAAPAPAADPAPAPAPEPAPAAPPSGDVWAALAQCESGGRADAVSSNGRYYGLYQFSLATWQSVGGSGLPSEASPEEQTMRAQALQERSGWGQWPACSRKLGLR